MKREKEKISNHLRKRRAMNREVTTSNNPKELLVVPIYDPVTGRQIGGTVILSQDQDEGSLPARLIKTASLLLKTPFTPIIEQDGKIVGLVDGVSTPIELKIAKEEEFVEVDIGKKLRELRKKVSGKSIQKK